MAVVVLGYHDLAADNDYSSWMKVKISCFEKHLRILKSIGNFICPDDLNKAEILDNTQINILLTFDDGFINHYRLGYPLLVKYEIPAMFFISTWNTESGAPFWFDRIIHPIQRFNLESLDLRAVGLGNYYFPTGKDEARWDSIQSLLEDVKRINVHQEDVLINAIAEQMELEGRNVERGEEHEVGLPLGIDHIREMRRSGLCYFGSHSHKHSILTKLSDQVLSYELSSSRNRLEKMLGEPVQHICYPNGDVDDRVIKACLSAGFRYGYISNYGRFDDVTDYMRIPRILIGGFDFTPKLIFKVFKALLQSKKGI